MDLRGQAEAMLRAGGVPFESLVPHAGGAQHQLYKVVQSGQPQRLLKVPKVDCLGPERSCLQGLQAECSALTLMRDVPVPTPYVLLNGGALMGYVPGQAAGYLYAQGRLSTEALSQVCFSMGKQLAAIHRHRLPQDYQGGIPFLNGDFAGPRRLVHGDYHLGNVQLVMDRRRGAFQVSGVVDWVNCAWGPPEWDFVEMHISVFRQLKGSRDAFLGGYRSGPLRPRFVAIEEILAGEKTSQTSNFPRLNVAFWFEVWVHYRSMTLSHKSLALRSGSAVFILLLLYVCYRLLYYVVLLCCAHCLYAIICV